MKDNLIIKTLDNNLKVILIQNNNLNSINIHFRVKAGSNYENKNQIGIAHLLEHIILSKNKENIVRNGSKIIGITSRDDCLFSIKTLKEHFEESLEYLYTILIDKEIKDLKIQKEIIKQEIKRSLNSPEKLILRRSYKTLYPNTRMAILNTGEEADINKITEEEMVKFKNSYYTASNSILVIYGNIDNLELVNKYFSKLPKGKKIKDLEIEKTEKANKQIIKIKDNQKHIKIDYYGYTIKDNKRYPLKYLEYILNTYLNEEIRHKKGLTYKINTVSFSANNYGTFSIYTISDKKNILEEIDKVLKNTKKYIDDVDLDIIKNNIVSELIFELEKPTQITAFYSENYLFDNEITPEQEIQKYKEVTKKDILTVYNEIMDQGKKITILKGEN